MQLTFRDATEADRDTLEALNRAAYHEVVVAQFGAWDEPFEAAIFAEKWATQRFEIVARDGVDVAVVWVVDNGDHLWLREIQVYPVYQSRGVGTALIMRLMDEARRRAIPIRLQVLKMNRAMSLYQRLGFSFTNETTDSHFWMCWPEQPGCTPAADAAAGKCRD